MAKIISIAQRTGNAELMANISRNVCKLVAKRQEEMKRQLRTKHLKNQQ